MNIVPISFNIDCEHLPFTQFSVGTFLQLKKLASSELKQLNPLVLAHLP